MLHFSLYICVPPPLQWHVDKHVADLDNAKLQRIISG